MAQNRNLQDWLNQVAQYAASPFNTFGSLENGIMQSAAGDPEYGKPVDGTNYQYNDLTQMQVDAMQWFSINNNLPGGVAKGEPQEATLQQVLDLAKGLYPADVHNLKTAWNWSYSQWEQFLGFKLQ